jgi:hypothetical protein
VGNDSGSDASHSSMQRRGICELAAAPALAAAPEDKRASNSDDGLPNWHDHSGMFIINTSSPWQRIP